MKKKTNHSWVEEQRNCVEAERLEARGLEEPREVAGAAEAVEVLQQSQENLRSLPELLAE